MVAFPLLPVRTTGIGNAGPVNGLYNAPGGFQITEIMERTESWTVLPGLAARLEAAKVSADFTKPFSR